MSTDSKTNLSNGAVFFTTINALTKGELISPSTQTTVAPLPPLVSAKYNEALTTVTVSGTVFIDASDAIASLDIYLAHQILGAHTQELYIAYDYKEVVPTSLYPYYFSFEMPIQSHGHTIKTLESYLWNIDPISSRGTETTVQNV
ncbi:hypothetical protein [Flavobacterium sp. 7A]|uniref:hypothetical protein n=1 Tax=Flavobacterium sp. 7A TaxID=2940571 RepID=UPI002227B1B9|nr:hypothetical protein [Flavobacterium sp. 7A]MCW2117794.1 hypothetical protein [Flavobacterium sp. 7A]